MTISQTNALAGCTILLWQSSALHVAARSNQLSAVKLLLSKGADPLLPDKDGLTPLDHARVRHRKEVVDLLWQHIRADPPPLKQVRWDARVGVGSRREGATHIYMRQEGVTPPCLLQCAVLEESFSR